MSLMSVKLGLLIILIQKKKYNAGAFSNYRK